MIAVILLWLAVAVPHVIRTPDAAYAHDFDSHVEYTRIIHEQHRLPKPGEGWETHQPPLYYLIASQLGASSAMHVRRVRLFSVLLGAITLAILVFTLQGFRLKPLMIGITLSLLATTPQFVFVFSTYNNDALAVCAGIGLWALFLSYLKKPTAQKAAGLGLITLLGFYTKLSFGIAGLAVAACALYLWRCGSVSTRSLRQLVITQLAVFLLVFAWMHFHNYRSSGHWIALNSFSDPGQSLPHSALQTIFTPPGFTHWEWTTPFTDHFLPVGKKNSLLAYAWASSIFGEHTFHQVKSVWVWLVLWIHTLWLFSALTQIRRSETGKIMAIAIATGGAALAGYVMRLPYGSAMDFRHVAWIWLPLAVLQSQALENFSERWGQRGKQGLLGVILFCVVVQWALIAVS